MSMPSTEQQFVPVPQRRKDVAEGSDHTLHEISTLLTQEGNLDFLYSRILDAAMGVMSSDTASIQSLDHERNNLQLLAWKGFHPQSAAFWEWVYLESASTCGLALFSGCRVVVPNVETCNFMAGTADLEEYRRSNIRAVQSTPLVSRSGQLLGMISTHWHDPRQPTEVALRRLDVLARQAADLVERSGTEAALANNAAVLANTPFLLTRCSSDLRYLFVSEAYAKMLGHPPEEVVGKKIVEVMGETGFQTILPHIKAVLAGQRVEYETEVHFKDVGPRLLHVIYTPDKDRLGQVGGWVASIIDITERKLTEAALSESEQRLHWLASIVDSSDEVIVSKNLDGIITSWNKGAERVFGYTAEEAIGQPITIVIPEDRQSEEHEILTRIRRGERIDHFETVRRRKDGSLVAISLTVSPIKSAKGKIVGASKIARDITEQKRSQEQIATLAREAEHRSKNLLANVQATVNLSQSDTSEGLKRAIEGRIQALANVHSLFVDTRWIGAELSTIATQELAPYSEKSKTRVRIEGPQVLLEPNAAQTVAVILHELATNAAKYGALSAANGQVDLKWLHEADGRLHLRWTETGGPAVQKPTRKGFGGRVTEQLIAQLKGKTRFDWRAEGLVCEITLQA
jgi:PAS domain S-box-containing protein